jgi:hypothetical protein
MRRLSRDGKRPTLNLTVTLSNGSEKVLELYRVESQWLVCKRMCCKVCSVVRNEDATMQCDTDIIEICMINSHLGW